MTLTIFLLFVIQSPCARYGTQPVVLTGIIKAHAFPGRPSYESIARGDEPERTWLIHLDKPICIETDMFSPKENVSKLQLVFEEGRRQYEISSNARAKSRG